MRILLDTDVVLDFLLARQPFEQEARAIWIACAQGHAVGYVCPITPVAAHALPMADFEDAVQAATAAAAGLDAVVPRNTKHYSGAPIPALTPGEVLARLSAAQPPSSAP
jgi:predicted nucleic acid-binding protein